MGHRIPIMDRLRNETRIEHQRVELLPFAAALAASKLPIESYVAFLDALHVVHSSFEQAMTSTEHPVLQAIWDDSLRQLPRLQCDLAFFQPQRLMKSLVVSIRAQLVAQRIRQRATDNPLTLLGYLYVLTGATLGGTILKPQIAQHFGLEGSNGLAYLTSHEDKPNAWRNFRSRMNAAPMDDNEQQSIIDAARETFAFMGQIVEALYPFEVTDARLLARTLNWEAGRHVVPQDEREIDASLRAGEQSRLRFPYYKLRYGTRGERFTRSDSAWLATLAGLDQVAIDKQITWLGHVLSARGMPQWLLENHLCVLHEALVSAVPENAATYDRILHAAEMLGRNRRKHVSDDVMAACAAAFERYVGDEWNQKLPEAGSLLAAAVADEKQGITLALPSVEAWMVDENRFPQHWIDAVHKTIQMARENSR